MKAIIFAAGLGTRLRPLTDNAPKALVEINGKTLLEIQIEKLIDFGIDQIIVNVHHFADQVKAFIEKKKFRVQIEISDESGQLLDTGGGLKKAKWFLKDSNPFLVHNVDVLSDIDLNKMLSFHNENQALATLAVRKRKSSRYFLFNNENLLSGWQNVKTNEKVITREAENLHSFAFSGIHLIDPKIFSHFPSKEVFSIVEIYLNLSKHSKIEAFRHDESKWFDVGTSEKLKEAEQF